MSHLFYNRMLLLLFGNNLGGTVSAPPRLSIKLTTVVTRPATRGGTIGQLPPSKIFTNDVFVRCCPPRKYQLVAALVVTIPNTVKLM